MRQYQELLNMSDTQLLNEYKDSHPRSLESQRDSISLILNYRFSKRMIRLTLVIGVLAFSQLIIVGFQLYLIFKTPLS